MASLSPDMAVRWERYPDLDDRSADIEEPRVELLREIVDELPVGQSLAISLLFFGGGSPTQAEVAAEMGLTEYRLKRLIADGLDGIRKALLEEDRVGSLRADDDPRIRAMFSSLALGADEDSA